MSFPSGRYALEMLTEIVRGLPVVRLDVQVFRDEFDNQQVGGVVVVDVLGELKHYQIGTADGFRFGATSITKLLQAVGRYGLEVLVVVSEADQLKLELQKVEAAQTHYLKLVALRRRVDLFEREKLKAFERDRQLNLAANLIADMQHGDASQVAAWLEADTQRICVGTYLAFLTYAIAELNTEIAALEAEQMPETGGIKRQIIIDMVLAWQDFVSEDQFLIGKVPAGRALDSIKIEVAATALNTEFWIFADGWNQFTVNVTPEQMASAVNGAIEYAINLPALETEREIWLSSGNTPTQGAARFVVRCD